MDGISESAERVSNETRTAHYSRLDKAHATADSVEDLEKERLPGHRNTLAVLAGFAAVLTTFARFSVIPLIFTYNAKPFYDLNLPDDFVDSVLFFLVLPLPGLLAPVTLWLAVKAWLDLRRHPHDSGKIETLLALTIGFAGTVISIREIHDVARALYGIISEVV